MWDAVLAHQNFLDDPAFINYINYLQYWRTPEYSQYITYPHSLYFLELLQSADFRSKVSEYSYTTKVEEQQLLHYVFSGLNKGRNPTEQTNTS
jgi:mediator of RNA polymerase II transcription subunit 31